MMYRKMECPWCGNETTFKGEMEPKAVIQKCKWCRRWVDVTCRKIKGKIVFEAEEKDFPEPVREPAEDYQDRYQMSMSGLEYGR